MYIAARSYSSVWCRALATKLLRRIPTRELRDMIYMHLFGDSLQSESVHIASGPEADDIAYTCPRYGPFTADAHFNEFPYYLDAVYMGNEFVDEISATFYEHACLSIHYHRDILRTLEYGPLQPHPILPPYKSIRRLETTLSMIPSPLALET